LFSDVNVSQGSVTIYTQGVVEFLITGFTANLPRNLPVKNFENRLRFSRMIDEFVGSLFWHTL